MNLHQQIGAQLKNARIEKKLSQQKLADASKIEQKRISKLENGKTDAKISTVEKLAATLSKKVNFILTDQK